MLVITIYSEYWKHAYLDCIYCLVECFYVSATSCVFLFLPVSLHGSTPENLLLKQLVHDTEPVHSSASGTERFCCREIPLVTSIWAL